MIELFKRSDTFSLPRLFQSMHADRKRVFVDMLKWDGPHDENFEQDQYDTDSANYLILRDGMSGEHRGSVRLLPSMGPHILRDVFPFLCDGKVPVGPVYAVETDGAWTVEDPGGKRHRYPPKGGS